MPLPYRYLFVGGLHRSGTSLLARLIARLPDVAAIRDAPVPENEGAYLQGAIPHDAQSGRPMHFATDPAHHLTEAHPLNTLETRTRIEADWATWFGPGTWRVEKSPVNLTRMRLLQQLFPLSQFVVILRHPEAVASAVEKWVDTPRGRMIDHWLDAHAQLAGDLPYLHSALVLRYEDLVRDPARIHRGIAVYLDVPPGARIDPEALRDGNADYAGAAAMTREQALRADAWGYAPGLEVRRNWQPVVRHPLRDVRENVFSAMTDLRA